MPRLGNDLRPSSLAMVGVGERAGPRRMTILMGSRRPSLPTFSLTSRGIVWTSECSYIKCLNLLMCRQR